ncbi:MAG: hypothetical protein ACPGVU_04890 [Limisphaerales bacterium]
MNWRILFLVVGPVAFAYYLHKAGKTADSVTDADVFSAFVNLIIAFPFGLLTAWAYASAVGEWFGGAVWSQYVDEPDSDHPHWLVTLTGKFEHRKHCFLQRWTCFLATQLTAYTGWAILYRRGMNAAKPNTWMERYFATCLYPFPNAFDAMKATEVLHRNGIDPKAHPDPQVALFILRAEMPDREPSAPLPSMLPGDLEPVSEPAAPPLARVVATPVEPEQRPRKKKFGPGLQRNKGITLFEGAEPGGPVWKTHGRDPKELVGCPYGDRRSTTVLFVAPSPPPKPFKPIRLPHQRRGRV